MSMLPKRVREEDILHLLEKGENDNLEFKKAEHQFSFSDLQDYIAGIANSGGGLLILGVTDERPRTVNGTVAFATDLGELPYRIWTEIRVFISAQEFTVADKRIVIFSIPTRDYGRAIRSKGKFHHPIRIGESLVEMDDVLLRSIHLETTPDFSSQICEGAKVSDLDTKAIRNFAEMWAAKQGKPEYRTFSDKKILSCINATNPEGEITNAALILFGTEESLEKYFPASEISLEWRSTSEKERDDYREDWKTGFFSSYDQIWRTINARNYKFSYREGLIRNDLYAYNEIAVREALLNAVSHRDYRDPYSPIFIRINPETLSITSPGGLLPGITMQNIFAKHASRNKLIAEIFQKAGFVERAGQGMEVIFSSTIREGKGAPNFDGTDNQQVQINIPAQVKDEQFIIFLQKIASRYGTSISFEELLELEEIRTKGRLKDPRFKKKFIELGIIERVGRTSDSAYVLSKVWYEYIGRPGKHTATVGLERGTYKELIVQHLKKHPGARSRDFRDGLHVSPILIRSLLQELKREGRIRVEGNTAAGKWFAEEDK